MHGVFARWRVALVIVTQLVFYGLPWLTWNDRQAVLFDLGARKFYVFGLIFWPQDFIFVTGLLVISALSLFLFTAVAGRLWCGYACPQTVYTEMFMWIERKIEGDRTRRVQLDKAPWSARKLALKGAKQALDSNCRLDWVYLRRLFHADTHAGWRAHHGIAQSVGRFLDTVLRRRDLRQRGLPARAGVQIHVPLCTLSERDVRSRYADSHL